MKTSERMQALAQARHDALAKYVRKKGEAASEYYVSAENALIAELAELAQQTAQLEAELEQAQWQAYKAQIQHEPLPLREQAHDWVTQRHDPAERERVRALSLQRAHKEWPDYYQ